MLIVRRWNGTCESLKLNRLHSNQIWIVKRFFFKRLRKMNLTFNNWKFARKPKILGIFLLFFEPFFRAFFSLVTSIWSIKSNEKDFTEFTVDVEKVFRQLLLHPISKLWNKSRALWAPLHYHIVWRKAFLKSKVFVLFSWWAKRISKQPHCFL